MSDPDFGGTVRDAREALGLSQTRVAELVGRAPSTIRAWERGRSVPNEPTVVSSLAAVLGLSERDLFEIVGLEPPGPRTTQTLEQTLSEIAPTAPRTGSIPDPRGPLPPMWGEDRAKKMASGPPKESRPAVERVMPQDQAPEPVFQPVKQVGVPTTAADAPLGVEPRDDIGLRDRERRQSAAWGDRLRHVWQRITTPRPKTRPAGSARRAAPTSPASTSGGGVGVLAPPRTRSYIEDPEQRLIYRLRSVFLAIGVFVLFVVFVWSAREFLDALGASLDAIFGPE